jgi:hypothetical protein
MNHTGIKGTAQAGIRTGRARRRPSRSGRLRVSVCGLLAAGVALFAASGPAQAAGPSASLAITPASISAGTQPVVTYITAGIPTGAAIYLQLASGANPQWQDVGRIRSGSGSVKAPADPAGQWRYRILVAEGSTTLATSAASTLTVTGSSNPTSKPAGCTACKIAKAALPWLEPIAAPVIVSAIQTVGQAILDFFGWLIAF